MEKQKSLKIIDSKKTQTKLYVQLSIIQKIIHSIVWLNKEKFDKSIFYQITKFLFRNPLVFVTPIYKKINSTKLKIEEKKSYILINNELQIIQQDRQQNTIKAVNHHRQKTELLTKLSNNSQDTFFNEKKAHLIKQGQYSIHIKVHRFWKNLKINYANSSFKQIIMKSRHLIQFLKNIKIDNPKNVHLENSRAYQGQNIQEKQNKIYTLICQNYDYILSKINQIQENEKQKRLDDVIAKTYVQMMNKNIVILTVQKNNFNPISYKSEGKYIYVSNHVKNPLFSQKFQRIYSNLQTFKIQKSLLNLIPYIETNFQGQWCLKNRISGSLQLFQEKGEQIDRGNGVIIDRYFNFYKYDDFSIQRI